MKMPMKKFVVTLLTTALTVSIVTPSLSAKAFNKELSEVRTHTGSSKESYIDGRLHEARFNYPSSFAYLSNGDIVIADSGNHLIRQMSDNNVSTLTGFPYIIDGEYNLQGGYLDGSLNEAAFNLPTGLAIGQDGSIYIADSDNHAIRKISSEGQVSTVAGNGLFGLTDGKVQLAQFYNPSDIAIDSKGNLYVADTLNHVIRKIARDGSVTTLNKPSERLIEYTPGVVDYVGDFADGILSQALFNEPTSLLIDNVDNLYVADRGNQRIRYIDFATNSVTTVAGSGELEAGELYVDGGYVDGDAKSAQFFSPEGMAWLDEQTLLIADRKNHTIRQLKDGKVSTLAGIAEEPGSVNGVTGAALFNEPVDLLVDNDSAILVLDAANHQIRKIASYTTYTSAKFSKEVEVVVNGTLLDTRAEIQHSRTLLPLKAIGNALNLIVNYEEKTKLISLSNNSTKFEFTINDNKVTKTELGVVTTYTLDSAATMIKNVAYIPVRFISEQLNLNVAWDAENKNVVIRNFTFN